MTEASDDGNYLVRVRAQVMTRDDSSGGWVPLSGGGLANVSVRRRAASGGSCSTATGASSTTSSTNPTAGSSPSNNPAPVAISQSHGTLSTSPPSTAKRRHEYLIYGKRITDQSVVLSCTIKKDFQYNKVMPTFHHWRTGEKKFGLTFQTAADARAFDKGVRTAVEELLEGLANATLNGGHPDVGDESVFMTVNLPVEPPDPRQSSDQGRGIVRVPNYHSQCSDIADAHKSIHYIGSEPSSKVVPPHHHPLESSGDVGVDNCPYVQLTSLNHDYLYPVIDDHKGNNSTERRTSSDSLKKPDIIISQPSKNSDKLRGNCRLRCKHCQQTYGEHDNPRGACEYAPDLISKGIATVSCLLCAKCMLYHCMSDAEGENSQNLEHNPCTCSTEDGCGRRWFGLALLSLIVPCLWLYPPLRAIHWCGMACGICGGRHHPME
ncbi:sprouty-related, EVH1 domain-containing protein 3 isoform X1 [Fopius arisanus]|uniref:Sprouty-related, EVH1 domain-containing protein 3 isoform X1 n=1 Tax=Fopius arisanus TaxID=64838 RepID=A0A9R1T4Z9_9HYME|nr:PREDICTED: sprouty-related, EVH1 domain-containing protein 3 isoform X1 [Fopius arisanus]